MKGKCEDCGEVVEIIHNHHKSYDPPETVALCPKCHSKRHHPIVRDPNSYTQIQILKTTAAALADLGKKGESYDDIIRTKLIPIKSSDINK